MKKTATLVRGMLAKEVFESRTLNEVTESLSQELQAEEEEMLRP